MFIRTAAQMARAFGANFTALYVQTAEPAEKTSGGSGKAAEAYPPGRTERGGDCNDAQRGHCPADCRICENFRSNADCHWKSMMDQGFFRKRRGWTERLTDLVPDLEIHIIPDSNIITIYLVGVMMTSILTSGYTCSVISSVISVVLFNYFLTEPSFQYQPASAEGRGCVGDF